MATPAGGFVWYELMTPDPAAAAAFYGAVVGWQAQEAGTPGKPYTLFAAGGPPLAGALPTPPEARDAGAPPRWFGYVGVADVDAIARRVVAAGGAVHRPAEDIPEVGRFAVVADPHGALFVLFAPAYGGVPPPTGRATGRIGWHELMAGDLEHDFAFYAGLFGWTKDEAHDMGPMGIYQLFRTGGDQPAGGMMACPLAAGAPAWRYYVVVDAIDEAADRVRQAGGTVVGGPYSVPGGDWILHATDPQGAWFALVADRR